MASKLLFLVMFLVMTLLGDRMVHGAPAANTEDACTQKAFAAYERRTKHGCTGQDKSPERCKFLLEFSVLSLNKDLAKCGDPDAFSLCRVRDPGVFSFRRCSAVREFSAITKAECEAARKKPYTFHGAGGSKTTYSPSEAICVNSPNYRCISLC
ncbi:hypothetical protein BD408DRAFT_408326 [Parasitella parasitica]|nr:hypothetical protein BD408DRAFT_408326 [Parasitella parasitica]